jgi:hypothetical protein
MKIECYVKLGKIHILITRIKLAAKNNMDPLQIPATIANLAVSLSLRPSIAHLAISMNI